mgnify:CR=1 FL=1
MDTRKNKGISGAGLLVLVVFLFAVLWFTNMFENQSDRLTWSEFQTLVTGDNVDSISVIQNKNVPTGHVEIKLKKEDKDGKQVRYLYVSDINEVQDYLKENKLDYDMADVPQDTLFSTTILPVLLTLAGVMFIFMMMNRQGGNAGSKAMSFGKSRAKLSTDSDKKVTFDHVAGLKEEKEELEEIVDFLKVFKIRLRQLGLEIGRQPYSVGAESTTGRFDDGAEIAHNHYRSVLGNETEKRGAFRVACAVARRQHDQSHCGEAPLEKMFFHMKVFEYRKNTNKSSAKPNLFGFAERELRLQPKIRIFFRSVIELEPNIGKYVV